MLQALLFVETGSLRLPSVTLVGRRDRGGGRRPRGRAPPACLQPRAVAVCTSPSLQPGFWKRSWKSFRPPLLSRASAARLDLSTPKPFLPYSLRSPSDPLRFPCRLSPATARRRSSRVRAVFLPRRPLVPRAHVTRYALWSPSSQSVVKTGTFSDIETSSSVVS